MNTQEELNKERDESFEEFMDFANNLNKPRCNAKSHPKSTKVCILELDHKGSHWFEKLD